MDVPACSDIAVWGHKGSSAKQLPASSETAVWGHKGSSAKTAASSKSSHREYGGEKVVAPNASKTDDPAGNSPVTSVPHSNKSVARSGHSSHRIQINPIDPNSVAVGRRQGRDYENTSEFNRLHFESCKMPRSINNKAADRHVDSWSQEGKNGRWTRIHRSARRAQFTPF